jgi:CspA family cold shock protein
MQTGTVKWFNNTKGFGFIAPDEGSQDLFVHYSDLQMGGYRHLTQGQRVTYSYNEGPKGPAAAQVSVLEELVVASVEVKEEVFA